MAYCPHCGALFFSADALAMHRKACKVWAGEPKAKAKPIEPVHDAPDEFDDWQGA